MNKKILIAAIVIVLAGGAYFFLGKNNSLMSSQNQNEKATPQSKSLADFLSMSGNKKCTFSDASSNSSGTLYLSNGEMSSNFSSTTNGKQVTSHMVDDKKYFYIWTEGDRKGYKISVDVMKNISDSSSTTEEQTSSPIDFKQKANYSCNNWSPDPSLFTVPTTISFTDYTATMEQMMQATEAPTSTTNESSTPTGNNQAACSACAQLSGDAQAQCKAALQCQ